MCEYCESSRSEFKCSRRNGYYATTNTITIKNSKLIINTSTNRRTPADDYYESWGLDCDGERTYTENIFSIKFCPFCGKKLKNEYQPKIFLYINDEEKANEFCEKIDWLVKKFDYERLKYKNKSSNAYYLSKKVFNIINTNVKQNKYSLALKNVLYLYSDKPKQYEFNEIKSFLSEGYDVFIEMHSNYQYREYVINKLKKFKYENVYISIENIKENLEKSSLDIVIDTNKIDINK